MEVILKRRTYCLENQSFKIKQELSSYIVQVKYNVNRIGLVPNSTIEMDYRLLVAKPFDILSLKRILV